jgi:hypothetical protein
MPTLGAVLELSLVLLSHLILHDSEGYLRALRQLDVFDVGGRVPLFELNVSFDFVDNGAQVRENIDLTILYGLLISAPFALVLSDGAAPV